FFSATCHHGALHSFPTRRSSDLNANPDTVSADIRVDGATRLAVSSPLGGPTNWMRTNFLFTAANTSSRLELASTTVGTQDDASRSEEHTSELQSRSDLVCRLLLE